MYRLAIFSLLVIATSGPSWAHSLPFTAKTPPPIFHLVATSSSGSETGRLASKYLRGDGVKQDKAKAVALFKQAASQHDGQAAGILGWLYENGDGVPQSLPKAAEYYKTGAAANDGFSQTRLGIFRLKGIVVEQNDELAKRLFNKARFNDYDMAHIYYGDLIAREFVYARKKFNNSQAVDNVRHIYMQAAKSQDPEVAALARERIHTVEAARGLTSNDVAVLKTIGIGLLVVLAARAGGYGPDEEAEAYRRNEEYARERERLSQQARRQFCRNTFYAYGTVAGCQ